MGFGFVRVCSCINYKQHVLKLYSGLVLVMSYIYIYSLVHGMWLFREGSEV